MVPHQRMKVSEQGKGVPDLRVVAIRSGCGRDGIRKRRNQRLLAARLRRYGPPPAHEGLRTRQGRARSAGGCDQIGVRKRRNPKEKKPAPTSCPIEALWSPTSA